MNHKKIKNLKSLKQYNNDSFLLAVTPFDKAKVRGDIDFSSLKIKYLQEILAAAANLDRQLKDFFFFK